MGGTKTILLIDDNDADNAYHEIILRRHPGVQDVVTKESAMSGLQYLRTLHSPWPDLVFVDINMPGMDGFDCIEQLVRFPPATHTRFFVLTSSDAEQDRSRASQLPIISEYLIKPLTAAVIARLLQA